MSNKIEKIKNDVPTVDGLFKEVQAEVNQEALDKAKIQIKDLLRQKANAEKVVANIDRQIEELKLKLSQELQ